METNPELRAYKTALDMGLEPSADLIAKLEAAAPERAAKIAFTKQKIEESKANVFKASQQMAQNWQRLNIEQIKVANQVAGQTLVAAGFPAAPVTGTGEAASNLYGQDYIDYLVKSGQGQIAYDAQAMADYSMDPRQFRSFMQKGAQSRNQQVVSAALRINPFFKMYEYDAMRTDAIQYTAPNGRGNIAITNLNQAMGHLATAWYWFQDMNNRGWQGWNYAANYLEQQFSGPNAKAIGEFRTAMKAVTDEMSVVFKNSGTGSDEEIKAWSEKMNADMTPDGMSGAVSAMMGLMLTRVDQINANILKTGLSPNRIPVLQGNTPQVLQWLMQQSMIKRMPWEGATPIPQQGGTVTVPPETMQKYQMKF